MFSRFVEIVTLPLRCVSVFILLLFMPLLIAAMYVIGVDIDEVV